MAKSRFPFQKMDPLLSVPVIHQDKDDSQQSFNLKIPPKFLTTGIQEIGPNIKPTEIKIPHNAYVIMFSFLSAQVTASVYVEDYLFAGIAGTILGYQRSSGHPNNLHIDLQGGLSPMAGTRVGWAW